MVRAALRAADDSPGYPLTAGTPALREAAAGWLARRHGVSVDPAAVLPVIGTKEFIAWLPTLLGCGPGDVVVHPALAYPTYDVGARLAGARPVRADGLLALGPERVCAGLAELAVQPDRSGAASRAPAQGGGLGPRPRHGHRVRRVLYRAGLGGDAAVSPASRRLRRVTSGPAGGALAVQAIQPGRLPGWASSPATPALVAELLEVRKHAGMIVPAPVQAAMAAALSDDAHADGQHARYAARRDRLRPALEAAGWAIDQSAAGLYLWASHPDLDCWGVGTSGWPEQGSWLRRARSTGPAAPGTSGSRSPRPTSASTRRSCGWPISLNLATHCADHRGGLITIRATSPR